MMLLPDIASDRDKESLEVVLPRELTDAFQPQAELDRSRLDLSQWQSERSQQKLVLRDGLTIGCSLSGIPLLRVLEANHASPA